MPRRCRVAESFEPLLAAQDQVVHREQVLAAGLTRRAIDHRLATRAWHPVLPGVYQTHRGDPSRRQLLIAALLYAGPSAALDGADAARRHGIRSVPVDDDVVHVVAPWGTAARSTGFVVVRRTLAPLRVQHGDQLRAVDAATAVVVATRTMRSDRGALAALSDAVQRRIVTLEDVAVAHALGPPRGSRRTGRALAALAGGAHSVAEVDYLKLTAASSVLPRPQCNVRLRLPSGRLISPDALYADAGLVHETNGRASHYRADLFEDMQQRHDAMTAAGLTVLHNSPRRLLAEPREVLAEVEHCYARLRGRGLPPDVALLL